MNALNSIIVRWANEADLHAMCDLINQIIHIGGTTAHRSVFGPDRMREHYLFPPTGISCFAAVENERLLGFQSLEWSDPNWPEDYQLPSDWASIATFVAPEAQGKGIGKALFEATEHAARDAGVLVIDATIRKENSGGQAYYGGLGFLAYVENVGSISRKFELDSI